MDSVFRKIWLVPVLLVVVLALLELALQVMAWAVGTQARHVEARWLTGHVRVLAVGDSNTYGLYLEAADAWPAQLERSWNQSHPGQAIEVLNLGYPGTNSFRVRENLPSLLDALSPDVVLIMVGFNDFWTPRETPAADDANTNPWHWVQQHSRVYRAWLMWERQSSAQTDLAFGSPRPSEVVDPVALADPANQEKHLLKLHGQAYFMGVRPGEPSRNMKSLQANLTTMIDEAHRRGANVALLTYPSSWGFYPGASKWIRKTGEATGVPVVDITSLFQQRCPQGPDSCSDLLFHDGHATAKGNALVASQVTTAFLEAYLAAH